MIKDPEIFYQRFQVNYYDYIQLSLKNILDNLSSSALVNKIIDFNESDYARALKSSIRQTYFHSIETVFEMIFALCPDKDGNIDDRYIMRTITKSEFPYKKIQLIAEDKIYLNFLDQTVKLTDREISLGHYIFYLGFYKEEIAEKLATSLEAIKKLLYVLAKDFADRREYNSYKHGLRIIPALKSFSFEFSEISLPSVEMNLEDSLTFYSENKLGDVGFITKVFDTDRDIKLTEQCSYLIWNIIQLRRMVFFKDKNEIPILFFDNETLNLASKQNIQVRDLVFKIEQRTKEDV